MHLYIIYKFIFKLGIIYMGVSQVVQWVKNLLAVKLDAGDVGSIPGSGRSPGRGHSNPFQ